MAMFLFIPGGWHGGWTFSGFAARLRQAGHEVWTPTLSGLEENSRQASGAINLTTHIGDVLELLAVEDLQQVILCSHSYGGMVATGVADRAPERLAALVYLDAFVPQDGQSWWDLAGEGYRQLALDRSRHDGFGVAPPEHLDRRCAPHPMASFLQEIRLSGAQHTIRQKVFVYAGGWAATPFTAQYQRLQNDPDWQVEAIDCRHDLVNAAPDAVLAILRRVAEAV